MYLRPKAEDLFEGITIVPSSGDHCQQVQGIGMGLFLLISGSGHIASMNGHCTREGLEWSFDKRRIVYVPFFFCVPIVVGHIQSNTVYHDAQLLYSIVLWSFWKDI